MELKFPKIKGTSAPLQLTRRLIMTDKLSVPPGSRLTLSRGKLGDSLYRSTTNFLRTGPVMDIPDPLYNNLHDPHLRDHFFQRDRLEKLKKGNLITDDNEVICSLKEYNVYGEYLRCLKMVATKTHDETQKQALMDWKCSISPRKADEMIKREGRETLPEEAQRLLPGRPCMKRPVLRSGVARVYGVKTSEVFQDDQRKFPGRAKSSQQSFQDGNVSERKPQILLPPIRQTDRQVLRSGVARVPSGRASEAYQKLRPLELKRSHQ